MISDDDVVDEYNSVKNGLHSTSDLHNALNFDPSHKEGARDLSE